MTNFLGLIEARRGEKDPRARLILGPWVHGGESEDRAGERAFGPQARLDYAGEILRFMDRYVRGRGNGLDAEPRVRAFVMGENVWRTGDTFPLPGTKPLSLYLASKGALSREKPAGAAGESAFVSDPAHPVVDAYGSYGAHDYRDLAKRSDVVVFETEPLPSRSASSVRSRPRSTSRRTEASGRRPLGQARGRGSRRDRVEPLEPGTDVLRVSERDGGASPRLLSAGEVAVIRLPNLRTGNLFAKGHRVRSSSAAASCRTSRATSRPGNRRRAPPRCARARSASTIPRNTLPASSCRP